MSSALLQKWPSKFDGADAALIRRLKELGTENGLLSLTIMFCLLSS